MLRLCCAQSEGVEFTPFKDRLQAEALSGNPSIPPKGPK